MKILSNSVAGVPGHDKLALDRIARKSAGFSGADLRAAADWVNNATLEQALAGGSGATITTSLFEQALQAFRPSTIEWLTTARAEFKPRRREEYFDRIFASVFRA
jgi:ATP-dependent Zn protease